MIITDDAKTWPAGWQEAYEERVSIMDERGTENRFDVARRAHADTWGKLQEWLREEDRKAC